MALLLVGFLALIAWAFDVTGMLIRRQELATMADLGAAAGGRLVGEEIAALATQNVETGMFPPPSEEDKKYPEKFITAEQREFIQTDTQFTVVVQTEIKKFIEANRMFSTSTFDAESNATITYPERINDCSDTSNQHITLRVSLRYNYPYILPDVAELLKAPAAFILSANGFYRIKVCP